MNIIGLVKKHYSFHATKIYTKNRKNEKKLDTFGYFFEGYKKTHYLCNHK